MANEKTSDYIGLPGGTINDTWLFDIADPVTINYKATALELKNYIGSASSTPIDLTSQLAAGGVTAFTIPEALATPSKSSLYYNGNRQIYGINYTVSGTTLTWITTPPSFALGSDDGTNSFWFIPTISLLPFTQLPAFRAEVNSTHVNVTGDGTAYTSLFQNDSTGDFYDLQSNYNPATGQYTAAFDQIFNCGAAIDLGGSITVPHEVIAELVHRNSGGSIISTYPLFELTPYPIRTATSPRRVIFSGSSDFKLSTGDTAEVVVTGTNSGKSIDIVQTYSQFYGHTVREI